MDMVQYISYQDFNPRPPWGGRQGLRRYVAEREDFNPRPPWGGRLLCDIILTKGGEFQSTPSVGRATSIVAISTMWVKISIHALRGEGDQRLTTCSFIRA